MTYWRRGTCSHYERPDPPVRAGRAQLDYHLVFRFNTVGYSLVFLDYCHGGRGVQPHHPDRGLVAGNQLKLRLTSVRSLPLLPAEFVYATIGAPDDDLTGNLLHYDWKRLLY